MLAGDLRLGAGTLRFATSICLISDKNSPFVSSLKPRPQFSLVDCNVFMVRITKQYPQIAGRCGSSAEARTEGRAGTIDCGPVPESAVAKQAVRSCGCSRAPPTIGTTATGSGAGSFTRAVDLPSLLSRKRLRFIPHHGRIPQGNYGMTGFCELMRLPTGNWPPDLGVSGLAGMLSLYP